MTAPQTTVKVARICTGLAAPGCGRVISVEEWPSVGEARGRETHGICLDCLRREVDALIMIAAARRWVRGFTAVACTIALFVGGGLAAAGAAMALR